jgi:serine/threonine protein kinase
MKAIHKELKFPLAIKIVSQTSKQLQQSLKTEIDVLKECRHENIVNYYGTILRESEVWVHT